MKICFIMDSLHPVVEASAEGLAKRGNEVILLSSTQVKEDAGTQQKNGVCRIKVYIEPSRYFEAWQTIFNPAATVVLFKLLREHQPNIIHFHGIHFYFSYASIFFARRITKRIFFTFHSTFVFSYEKVYSFIDFTSRDIPETVNYRLNPWYQFIWGLKTRNPFRNYIIRQLLKLVEKRFAVSQALQQGLQQNGIKNVSVLYNGIELTEYEQAPPSALDWRHRNGYGQNKIILFGGRLTSEKGVDLLLSAFEDVASVLPEVVLILIGKGPKVYEKHIIHRLHELDSGVKVFLIPWLPHKIFLEAVACSDVVTVPSVYLDPLPTIVLDAMALSRPVVGSCFGGVPEMILNGITGTIVNPIDRVAFAQTLMRYIVDPELSLRHGSNGFERVDTKFSMTRHLDQLECYYS